MQVVQIEMSKGLLAARLLCVFFLLTLSINVNSQELEYRVKAGYLYNFTKFVTWPKYDSNTFNVCILGIDPFGELINPIEQRTVAGRQIRLIRFMQFNAAKQCRILFIGRSSEGQYQSAGYPEGVLTVSEMEDFTEQGGMFALVVVNGKVRLRINLDACKKNNLAVSAKLLEVAEWIGGRDD